MVTAARAVSIDYSRDCRYRGPGGNSSRAGLGGGLFIGSGATSRCRMSASSTTRATVDSDGGGPAGGASSVYSPAGYADGFGSGRGARRCAVATIVSTLCPQALSAWRFSSR